MKGFYLVRFHNRTYVDDFLSNAFMFLRVCLSEGEEGIICFIKIKENSLPSFEVVSERGYIKQKGKLIKFYDYNITA